VEARLPRLLLFPFGRLCPNGLGQLGPASLQFVEFGRDELNRPAAAQKIPAAIPNGMWGNVQSFQKLFHNIGILSAVIGGESVSQSPLKDHAFSTFRAKPHRLGYGLDSLEPNAFFPGR
jgi:hypothetical protein